MLGTRISSPSRVLPTYGQKVVIRSERVSQSKGDWRIARDTDGIET